MSTNAYEANIPTGMKWYNMKTPEGILYSVRIIRQGFIRWLEECEGIMYDYHRNICNVKYSPMKGVDYSLGKP